jgi:Tfp pilus assembly pilus retraction ATPase PilT
MQTGRAEWMQLLEHDLIDCVKFWEISLDEALKYANNPQMIRDGVM